MIKQLLQAVQTELAKIKSIRYVDEDWGQLHHDSPPVQFPCALIDADGFNFQHVSSFAQKASGDIYITIADQRLSRTSANAPDQQKERAFEFLDVLEDVQKKIHLMEVDGFDTLIRKSVKRIRRNNQIREYRIVFGTEFADETE